MQGPKTAGHASQVDWSGVLNAPPFGTSNVTDVTQLKAAGWVTGQTVEWDGTKFIPVSFPVPIPGIPPVSGTLIGPWDSPGYAALRIPPATYGLPQPVWLRTILDVKLYGATGYGGVDDSPAINAAIFDLNTTGGYLRFPAGHYLVQNPLIAITGKGGIIGDGPGVSVLQFSSTAAFQATPSTSISISGVSMVLVTGTGYTGLSVSAGSGRIYLDNLEFSGPWGADVTMSGLPFGGTVTRCQFSGALQYNVWLNSVMRMQVSGCDFIAGTKGVYVTGGTSSNFNTFSNLFYWSYSDSLVYLGSATTGCRVQNITFGTCSCTVPIQCGTGNYVNEIHGVGGNFDTDFDQRRELYGFTNWSIGTIPSFGVGTTKLTMTGARLGDQASIGPPYTLPTLLYPLSQVVSNDTVQLTLANLSTSSINLGTGVWKVRLFN